MSQSTPRAKRTNFKWTASAVALLGTMTDSKVASSLGLTEAVVKAKRQRHEIGAFTPPVEKLVVPSDLLAQLGKVSDSDIARALGCTQPTISSLRRSMGIAAVRERQCLSKEADCFLGKLSDREIAKRFGVTTQCVNKRRRTLGIAKAPLSNTRKITPLPEPVVAQLGQIADTLLSKETGINVAVLRRMRRSLGIKGHTKTGNIPESAFDELGKCTDADFAEKHGISAPLAHSLRTARGIPSYMAATKLVPSQQTIELFGKMSYMAVARATPGFTARMVKYHREKLGIETFRVGGQPTESQPD
ncbi:hypothetical protein GIW05_00395 [Pseudomonas syringae]|uniref:hypothetical protein n=1 Tax=Pseudomonas syringae TaxID=317 RepID=UPI001F27DE00|nr:hypothetical protein [Pseudomonas syringae]MCF5381981.1 hypothetical protein [Pseudomonas syringae]MCF5419487.1 hypothetical protein [Pseudomonas syringae]MCF5454839.1 hypothetical protein [Pseudomonas syringae]MCF5456319.1 hypothetical protein [Pseudomonas syringae]